MYSYGKKNTIFFSFFTFGKYFFISHAPAPLRSDFNDHVGTENRLLVVLLTVERARGEQQTRNKTREWRDIERERASV